MLINSDTACTQSNCGRCDASGCCQTCLSGYRLNGCDCGKEMNFGIGIVYLS